MSEQPQSQRHRPEQDEPAHDEPSTPAAEHVADRYEVQRVTTYVEYEHEGYFDNYEDAVSHADDLLSNASTWGAGVAFEVLADTKATSTVVYEAST